MTKLSLHEAAELRLPCSGPRRPLHVIEAQFDLFYLLEDPDEFSSRGSDCFAPLHGELEWYPLMSVPLSCSQQLSGARPDAHRRAWIYWSPT